MSRPALGIDLGTTRSVAATLAGGRPLAIPNAQGQLATPSVVAFTPQGRVSVGQVACRQAAANSERTVSSVKRLIGSDHRFRIDAQEYSPQEISAFILRQLKEDAEAYLGQRVEAAVIGVPAYFNDRQRQATREAALLAGLEVLRLLSEPTAAALAYGLEREDAHTIMVWDLGGGTFDVSILDLGEGIFEVRAVSGDNSLGGDDFDRRIMEYLAQEYRRAWGVDYPEDATAQERLREAARKGKVRLSAESRTRVFIPLVEKEPAARHLEVALTRETLEALVADLLQRLVGPTRQALADAALTPQAIDRVILVGNGSKMPAVPRLVRELLGQEPYQYLDPDLVTALGAAVQAGMLLGQVERAVLLDVLPLSLGVETQGGLFARLIPRNTPLPASTAQVFTTAADGQTAMTVHLLQGERELASENVSLGRLELEGLPPASRGTIKVEVALAADGDGLVHVSARDLLGEREARGRFVSAKRLEPQEIQRRLREAQRRAKGDRRKRERLQASIEADNAIAAAEMALEALAAETAEALLRPLTEALWRLQRALAEGRVGAIRRRCAQLRQVLAALPPPGPAQSEVAGARSP